MQEPLASPEELFSLAHSGDTESLTKALADLSPERVADLLEHANGATRDLLFEALPRSVAGEVAALLDDAVRDDLIDDLPAAEIAELVAELDPDEVVEILEDTDAATTEAVLRQIDPREADEVRELLGYEDESAGRAMASGAPAVELHLTLGQAVETLRAQAGEMEDVHVVYVVDGAGRLRGYLTLQTLLLGDLSLPVEQVMGRDVVFAYTYEDQEAAVRRVERSDLPALPIVDTRGVLRGQIPHDRLREIVQEEASEDMYRMVGLSAEESIHSPFRFALGRRLPWLLVNLITAFIAASVVGIFEKTIERIAILAALQSIVAGQGGNAGVQTLTMIVRGMALGDLDRRNYLRTFFKELGLGFANGIAVGSVVGVVVGIWTGQWLLGGIIAAAMLGNMLAAATAGFLVPVLLRTFRQDPAQASGVFVTTVTDVCGFLLFLGLATLAAGHLH